MCKNSRIHLLSSEEAGKALSDHHAVLGHQRCEGITDRIVNGDLLELYRPHSVPDVLAVSMSTIAALSKELNMELASTPITPDNVDDIMREFGRYVAVPVRTIKRLLTRVLYASWAEGARFTFNSLLMKFLRVWLVCERGEDKLLIALSYLYFAFKAAEKFEDGDRYGFHIEINKRGKVYLVYHMPPRPGRKMCVMRWDLRARFSNKGVRSLMKFSLLK